MNPALVPHQATLSLAFPSAPFLVEYLDLNNADKFSISEGNSLAVRGWQTYSIKGLIVNIFGFAGHMIATTHVCRCSTKTAIDNM